MAMEMPSFCFLGLLCLQRGAANLMTTKALFGDFTMEDTTHVRSDFASILLSDLCGIIQWY